MSRSENFTLDGFKFTARWVLDESPDLSWLGEYASYGTTFFVKRRTGEFIGENDEVLVSGLTQCFDRNAYAVFGETQHFLVSSSPSTRKWLKSSGEPYETQEIERFKKVGITPTRKHTRNFWRSVLYAVEDYERMESYNNGGWEMRGCIVKREGTDEEESLWGIESDSEPSYFTEVQNDLAGELIARYYSALPKSDE